MFTLREYQQNAVDHAVHFLKNSSKTGALEVLPTGSGKSLVIANIAKELNDHVLVFQPSKEILEQNYNKLLSYGEEASIYSASLNSKEIGLTTFATIGSVFRKPEFFQQFKYILIDECHGVNAKEGMYKKFLDVVGHKVLGLTATPYRLSTDGYGGSILKFLTRTRPRVFEELIYFVQNGYLFENNFLAKLEYYNVGKFNTEKLKLNSTGADYTDQSVKQHYKEVGMNEMLYKAINKLLSIRKNILVFTRFVEEAEMLQRRFLGIAEIVHAKTEANKRAEIISNFKSGKTRVVTNVGILTTGFDYPELETVIIARPTRSLALYYQMIGRGIRIHPDKKKTYIVDMCDNYRRFGKVEELEIGKDSKNLWFIKNKKRQLTNVYFD